VRLVYLGTPQFAVPTLERIVEAGHEVAAVFTQPDRPKGRGQKDAMPPVKEAALRLGLAVHQPERVRRPEVVEQMRSLGSEAMVVVGYGQIIPQAILDIPPKGIINVHASLLPKYRGAAPIQWAIARGETRTGVTTMKIDAGLDTGDMLLKWETEIGPEETAGELGERLAAAGANLLVQTLSTEEILNRIRGFSPWPGCHTLWRGQRLRIWKARPLDPPAPRQGWLARKKSRLTAGTGNGGMEILEVQLEGKKRMETAAFLNAFPETESTWLIH